jgi:hypothetical protein
MPETPDTSAVVADIARGRACANSGHEREIERLTSELERERGQRQKGYQQAYAAQQALVAIATAMGLPNPVDGFDGSAVDVMPILDEINRLAGQPLDEEPAAPKAAPKTAAAQAGQDLGVKIGEQFLAALKPLGEQLLTDIKDAVRSGKAPR